MNDSVATQQTELARLSEQYPDAFRHFVFRRDGSGNIEIPVAPDACVIVTGISVQNLDDTVAATLTIVGSTGPQVSAPASALVERPLLVVFGNGTAVLQFTGVAQIGYTLRFIVEGFHGPHSALRRISRMATELGVTV